MNKVNEQKMALQLFASNPPGVLSKGIELGYKPSTGALEFTVVAGVKSVPQIGSDPERVDVTDLASDKRKYIAGLQDTDNLEFAVVYRTGNFSAFQTFAETATDDTQFQITYPDGLTVTFAGKPSVRLSAAEVNAALEFTIVVVVSDGPTFTPVV